MRGAIEKCTKRLIMSSNRLSGAVVDAAWLKAVEEAIKRGVNVTIILTENWPRPLDSSPRNVPYIELEKLRSRSSGRLRVLQAEKSEFFFAVCDQKLALITNSPFLAFRDKNRVFRTFAGMVLQKAALVEAFAGSARGK